MYMYKTITKWNHTKTLVLNKVIQIKSFTKYRNWDKYVNYNIDRFMGNVEIFPLISPNDIIDRFMGNVDIFPLISPNDIIDRFMGNVEFFL